MSKYIENHYRICMSGQNTVKSRSIKYYILAPVEMFIRWKLESHTAVLGACKVKWAMAMSCPTGSLYSVEIPPEDLGRQADAGAMTLSIPAFKLRAK